MIPAADCKTMADLRRQIDLLDAEIVALLIRRTAYIDRAAEIKPAEGLPARIPDRVEEVIARVRARSGEGGLDPDLAESVWRVLVEWSIAREERAMEGK